jgi:flagellar basal-body rod protein FlgF
MDNSIYIILSRQMAKFEDMAVTSNNIANINTPGYNAQRLVFNQYLVDAGNGKKDAYVNDGTAYRDTSNGALQTTGNPLDLAISGNGYFQIKTPLGTRYTKAGNFQIDANGMLINNQGYPVLGADGAQISIPTSSRKIEINGIGQISADGQSVGQVGVVEFSNEQAMTRLGNSLYDSKAAPQPATTARVVQGAIESSNVNGVTELVHVMDISRSVNNTAKFIETMYDLEQKTSSTLAQQKPAA